MTSSLGSDLEVDKVLIWKTEIPFKNKVRLSSYFSLMGLEWCLRFSYEEEIPPGSKLTFTNACISYSTNMYHVITLHQVINGQIIASSQLLDEKFWIKVDLMEPMSNECQGIGERKSSVDKNVYNVWFAGCSGSEIYKYFPCLYNCSEIKVVCKFYGKPPSTFQLDIGTGNRLSVNSRKLDKSVQVSSEVPLDLQMLSSDFEDLLEEEILPDVKLECGGETFRVHRSVLAARSKVFRAMFENKMIESETGAVKIEDIDVPVLKRMLKFIYSGKPEELFEDNTADLYEAADKYDIDSLKAACSYWMKRNLNEENYINYLQVASSHFDPDLKSAVIQFIIKKPSVLNSEAWFKFIKKPSELVSEVFEAYIVSKAQ